MNTVISQHEREYLRELAKKQLEYANLPVMEERKRLWYLHNSLRGERPMVVMEEASFLAELLPEAKCMNEAAKLMEYQLRQNILAYEASDDDKVMPDFFVINAKIDIKHYGLEMKKTYSDSGLGYHIDNVITDLTHDLNKLKPSTYFYDEQYVRELKKAVEDTIGDILPVRIKNADNYWCMGLTQKAVELMGMENMFCSMMDEPELFHKFMQFLKDDAVRFLRWQEENGLIFLNNGNDYMGAGSYCFSDELPRRDFSGKVHSADTWGHLNSQESIGISPAMFEEFIYPYYSELAKEFGLVYYGCCEPVDLFWDNAISKLPKLRKVSISAWCNEEFMAERLDSGSIIYSRKPSPNFIGIQKELDEDAFRTYIKRTLDLTGNCKKEFIFRDIYKLHGNLDKVKRAVQIVRELIA